MTWTPISLAFLGLGLIVTQLTIMIIHNRISRIYASMNKHCEIMREQMALFHVLSGAVMHKDEKLEELARLLHADLKDNTLSHEAVKLMVELDLDFETDAEGGNQG